MKPSEMGKAQEKGRSIVQGGWRLGGVIVLDSRSGLLKARQVRGEVGAAKKPGKSLELRWHKGATTASANGVSNSI